MLKHTMFEGCTEVDGAQRAACFMNFFQYFQRISFFGSYLQIILFVVSS